MNHVQNGIQALRVVARAPIGRLLWELDGKGQDGSQFVTAGQVIDKVTCCAGNVGLVWDAPDYDPLPDGFVMVVALHYQGHSEVRRRVWKWKPGTTDLCQAGAQTECLRAFLLDLVAMRTPHVEAPKAVRGRPENRDVLHRDRKPPKGPSVEERREFVSTLLLKLARDHATPGAVERLAHIKGANAEGINRSYAWAIEEFKREAAKQQPAQAAAEAAPSAGGTLLVTQQATPAEGPLTPEPQPSTGLEPVEGGVTDEPQKQEPSHSAAPHLPVSADPSEAATGEWLQEGAVIGPAPPPGPHCSVCKVSVWHVQKQGECWEACSFCRSKSATFYVWKGKGPKRHKQRWCPECAESESPKGKREPITGPAQVFKVPPEDAAKAAAAFGGASGLVEMPPEERLAKVEKLPQGEEVWA